MTKELRDLLAKLNAKKEEGRTLLAEDKLDEAKAITNEVKDIQAKIEILQEFQFENAIPLDDPLNPDPVDDKKAYGNVFFKALKSKRLDESEANLLEEHKALSSTTGEDGGYTVPEDIQTAINEYKRDDTDLSQFVTIEPVSTLKGSRVLEKEADTTSFVEFAEGAAVPDSDAPKFETINFTIKDLGGFLPIPNNLLNDSDAKLKIF